MMDEVMEPEAVEQASAAAERAMSDTRVTARHGASVLSRTAEALEWSAILAEQHAQRHEQAGRQEAAAEERRAAARARDAAARARVRAENWLKLLKGPET